MLRFFLQLAIYQTTDGATSSFFTSFTLMCVLTLKPNNIRFRLQTCQIFSLFRYIQKGAQRTHEAERLSVSIKLLNRIASKPRSDQLTVLHLFVDSLPLLNATKVLTSYQNLSFYVSETHFLCVCAVSGGSGGETEGVLFFKLSGR
jgi:hypothetical protein